MEGGREEEREEGREGGTKERGRYIREDKNL